MNNGSDAKLFFAISGIFASIALFSYRYYLPYGRMKDAVLLLQSTYEGNAVDPTYVREAMVFSYGSMVMMVLALVFALDELRKQRRANAESN